MSINTAQLLGALGLAQATKVAPALEGQYQGGDAGTIALLLLMLAQDTATLAPRTARAQAAMAALLGEDGDHHSLLARLGERHAALEGQSDAASRDLEQRILALYVEMADAAFLSPPAL